MIYTPHTLEVKRLTGGGVDEWGNPIPSVETWVKLGECRCDDNTTKEFTSENGSVYRPNFHVVCEALVKAGEEVRCMNGTEVRGQGKVFMVKRSNYFDYVELWL